MGDYLIGLWEEVERASEEVSDIWEEVFARCAATERRSVEQSQILVEQVRALHEVVTELAGELGMDWHYPKFVQAKALGIDAELAGLIGNAVRLSLDSYALHERQQAVDEESAAYSRE